MPTKTKTFDCVEMKNRIQAQRMAEYESRKGEFASYIEFVRSKTGDSAWARRMRRKLAKPRPASSKTSDSSPPERTKATT
jgi:hypothetical protein